MNDSSTTPARKAGLPTTQVTGLAVYDGALADLVASPAIPDLAECARGNHTLAIISEVLPNGDRHHRCTHICIRCKKDTLTLGCLPDEHIISFKTMTCEVCGMDDMTIDAQRRRLRR